MARSDSKFITNTIITVAIVTILGGVLVWRLNAGVAPDQGSNESVAASDGEEAVVTVTVSSSSYSPSNITVKQGQKVKMQLVTNKTGGCIRSFVIPTLGISKILPESGTTTVEFIAEKKGTIGFQCSMGMFRGTINVI